MPREIFFETMSKMLTVINASGGILGDFLTLCFVFFVFNLVKNQPL